MYQEYYGLNDKPFETVADPRFIYHTPQHEEAMARLNLVVTEQKSAMLLTGVFGCGKTVIAQALMDTLNKSKYEVAFVVNPQLNYTELLREIDYKLGIKDNLPTLKTDLMHILDEKLQHNADNGKNTVVIIDEAHLIEDKSIFEELRLLMNLQYNNRFLLTLILLGQPELKDKVSNIKQLEQRIFIRYHLVGLQKEQVPNYIDHRLKVAGATRKIFQDDAYDLIYEATGGIPRRINQICSLALFVGSGRKEPMIDTKLINEISQEYV